MLLLMYCTKVLAILAVSTGCVLVKATNCLFMRISLVDAVVDVLYEGVGYLGCLDRMCLGEGDELSLHEDLSS